MQILTAQTWVSLSTKWDCCSVSITRWWKEGVTRLCWILLLKSGVPWWPRQPSVGVHHTSDSGHTTRMFSARHAVAIVGCSDPFVRTEFIAGVLCCLAFQLLLLDHFPGGRWAAAHLADGKVWDVCCCLIFFSPEKVYCNPGPLYSKGAPSTAHPPASVS